MSQVVVTRDAGGKYLSAVRHSYPSGTNHRGVTRLGRRLLVTGSIEYTVKLASAISRRRRKFKTVHAQRPDQIPPRPFHASNAPFAKRRGRGSVATAGDAPADSTVIPAQAGTQGKTKHAIYPPPVAQCKGAQATNPSAAMQAGDARVSTPFPARRVCPPRHLPACAGTTVVSKSSPRAGIAPTNG